MAISQHADGSQTATINTEHFLGTDPDVTDGVFQFWVELSTMADGDTLEIRLYEKIRAAGDTAQQLHMWQLRDAQSDDIWASPTVILLNGWRFSIKQTAGTGRAFQWSIRKVA
jgi:hypothetical protein